MTWNSGSQIPIDDKGRTVAYGYVISGSETDGYRARAEVPLTASEVTYGCHEVLFADDLTDLLTQAQAELLVRSMVGQAAEAAQADAHRARGQAG